MRCAEIEVSSADCLLGFEPDITNDHIMRNIALCFYNRTSFI
jgi:hypothetical protein